MFVSLSLYGLEGVVCLNQSPPLMGCVWLGERFVILDQGLPKTLRDLIPTEQARADPGAWAPFVLECIAQGKL